MWSQVRILSLRTIVKVKLAQNRVVKSYASLVQLVERRSPKPDVVGSSPTGRERKSLEESLVSQYTQCYTGSGEMTEWPKVLHC